MPHAGDTWERSLPQELGKAGPRTAVLGQLLASPARNRLELSAAAALTIG